MKEFEIDYRSKIPSRKTIYAENEADAISKLKEELNWYGDALEVVAVKELKTYEVEFEYKSYQQTQVSAYSEEHLRSFFSNVAEHDPDEYLKNPEVVITKITEVTDEEDEEE